MAHKANTRDRQPSLFRAKCSTWAQDNQFSFISRSNDLLHVSFGLPRLRLPAFGVHLNAIFGIASDGILITCPIQVHLLRLISVIMDEVNVFRCNSIFEMVLGQNIVFFFPLQSILLRLRLKGRYCSSAFLSVIAQVCLLDNVFLHSSNLLSACISA